MLEHAWLIFLCLSVAISFFFSTLTYAYRDFSRTRLADYLGLHGGDEYFETLTERTEELVFVTAVFRQISNIVIWVSVFAGLEHVGARPWLRYTLSIGVGGLISLFCSVAFPHAIAKYSGEAFIGFSAPLITRLHGWLSPLNRMMIWLDEVVRQILGVAPEVESEAIEQDILSAVEEGEKEGVVGEQERALFENVIEFRDATAALIMTARAQLAALPVASTLDAVRSVFESSGHSRLLVYDGSLDKVVGFLFARDLIKLVGQTAPDFQLAALVRPPMFVPETKPLRDLLNDFRHQKVHVAVVLDEYGGTSGIVTIEDILEELVGELADEHEPLEPAMFGRIDERTGEADARLPLSELNAEMGLDLPEDAGYETVGGFISNSAGKIPPPGTILELHGARFTILQAEPQRILRVKIELNQIPAASEDSSDLTKGSRAEAAAVS